MGCQTLWELLGLHGKRILVINVPGLTDERHREGVIRAAKSCLIHNTLLHPPTIETVVTDGAAAATAGH